MTTIAELDCAITPTTDGEIAIINLESARQRSWAKFFADPTRDGGAETVVEHEQLTLQFVGDLSALDRVETLAARLNQIDAAAARVALIQAQVASMAHRFSDARHYLAQAEIGGAPTADVDRLRLNIDQACGSKSRQRARCAANDFKRSRRAGGFRRPWVSVGRSSRTRCRGPCLQTSTAGVPGRIAVPRCPGLL